MADASTVKWLARLKAFVARGYGLALVLFAGTVVLTIVWLHYYDSPLPFTGIALSAIAITFWRGRTKPGILAVLLATLIRSYFFQPATTVVARILYDSVFLVFALVMIGLTRSRDELEMNVAERTAELTAANEKLKIEIVERKRAEIQSRVLIDAIPQQIWSGPPDGRLDYFNERWRAYTGVGLEEARGDGWQRILHPDDRERVPKAWRESVLNGTPFEIEERRRGADGMYRWFLALGIPSRDAEGRIVRWYGTNTDIEDRKRAEEALRLSEQEQRQLVAQLGRERARLVEAQEVAKMGSWEAELQSLNVIWSEQTHRIFETDPAHFHPTRPKFREFIHPEDRAKVDAAFAASLDQRSPATVEYRIVMPDGRVKIIEEHWQAFYDEAGKPVRVAGTCRDITERVRSEEELQRVRDRIDSILNSVSDTFILFDRQWRYLYLNEAAVRATGRPLKEILGHVLWELFPRVVGTELDRQFHRAMNDRVHVEFDFHFLQAGIDQWWEIRTYPQTEGLAVFATEITERVRAEEELQRLSGQLLQSQDEERRRISRGLHDTTGQNLVALATDLSQIRASIPSSSRELRALASRCQELANQCVREVRTLSYLMYPPLLDESGLPDAIRQFLDGFTKRSGIKVELEVSPNFGRLREDVELALFRIVQESLTNIHRHSGSPRAKIILDRRSDYVTVEVSDTGRGTSGTKLGTSRGMPFQVGVGISSMKERVKLIGGSLEIVSGTSGTTVRARVPEATEGHEKTTSADS
jgi:PAS domain S-box-containing protein